MGFMRRNPFRAPVPASVVAKMTPPKPAETPAADGARTAPEPLTFVMPALAALGAVASIAAVAWVAQDRSSDRPRVKRRIDVILKDLETSCIGLAEILRRVRRNAKALGLDGPQGSAPIKLGLTGGRADGAGGQIYKGIVNDLATMLVLATQNSFDAISAIEDGEIDAPEQVFFGFGEAQEKLNRLLIQRAGVRATIDALIAVAEELAELVCRLKQFKTAA